jgi:hypothetical protein
MSDEKRAVAKPDEVVAISSNAFVRLLALRHQEMVAAKAILEEDGYCDFFVEGAGPAWHEAFEDVITGSRSEKVSSMRMAFVDRLRGRRGDGGSSDSPGYSDFFVEGGGPAWHEAFEDVIVGSEMLAADPQARARALSRLQVVDAYTQMRAGSE